MKIRWKTLLTRIFIWLIVEILFNSTGLDTIANYSEFVFDKNQVVYLLEIINVMENNNTCKL